MDTVHLIEVVTGTLVDLAYVLLAGYVVRSVSSYLNHRLEVLGKDSFLFYPRDRYTEVPPSEE